MRIDRVNNLQLVAAFSLAVLLIVIYFAAVEPAERTLSLLLLGLLALASVVVSAFLLFLRSVDERLFRVSEYQQRMAGDSSQLTESGYRSPR